METGETRPANMSRCCSAIKIVSDIFLWKKRLPPGEGFGRKKIGEVVMCSKCLGPIGDMLKEPDCPKEFTPVLWYQMMKKTGGDKFYCEFNDKGELVPFGGSTTATKPTKSWAAISAEAMDRLEAAE